jgi:transposase
VTGAPTELQRIIEAALRGQLDQATAEGLHALGPEAVAVFALAVNKRFAELHRDGVSPTPSTPSGMIPIYAKPSASKKCKQPGAKAGHPGARRATPQRIDRRESHRLKRCPDCGGTLQRCARSRTRIIEDIPEHIQPVVTEHTIHRDYCPKCKKDVEPVVPDAMPKAARIGHHVVALTSWFHYGLGVPPENSIP